MKKATVLFLLIFILSSCTEEQLACLAEQKRITEYYDELIMEAEGDLDEQARLEELKNNEMPYCFPK